MKEKLEASLNFQTTKAAQNDERENSRNNSIGSKNDQPFIQGKKIKKFSPLHRQVNNSFKFLFGCLS